MKSATELDQDLRAEVFSAVERYYQYKYSQTEFKAGVTPVPVSGRTFDSHDMVSLSDAMLDFWLTTGRFADVFEKELAKRLGVASALMTNSGSSANLLALTALTDHELGDRRLKEGDEVLTVAACFPTTVNPILQNRLTPVFVDVELGTYAASPKLLAEACTPKTKAIMIAHTLGNPFALDAVKQLAKEKNLWLIEDCCDALGSLYKNKPVGSFGDLATLSFYPAHHITTGEGGAVAMNDGRLRKLVASFRDWGRDCWCEPGYDNTCGKRFGWKLGDLPAGYDHKYIYSRVGYNLKATDLQASIGVSQLKKLDEFIAARKRNFAQLHEGLKRWESFLILPRATEGADPAWFGFPITVKADAPFTREDLTRFLTTQKIGTRVLFGGDITRQPYFKNQSYRVHGSLANTDLIMKSTFWIGTYPGLTSAMIDYMLEQFSAFMQTLSSKARS